MFIEFQLNTVKLLALIRNRIKQQKICINDTFTITQNNIDVAVVFDHIEIHTTTRLERVPNGNILVYGSDHVSGMSLQVVQPVTVHFVKFSDLGASDKSIPYPGLELTFAFFISNDKDGWTIHLDYQDSAGVPDNIKQAVHDNLKGAQSPAPLDLNALKDVTGVLSIAEAFIGTPVDQSFVAIRLEQWDLQLDGAASWGKFLNGQIDNNLFLSWSDPPKVTFDSNDKPIKWDANNAKPVVHSAGGDWSLFVNAMLFLPLVVKRFQNNLADNPKFRLKDGTGIDAYWDCAGHLPRVLLEFSGEAIDLGAVNQDVGVDVKIFVGLSAPDEHTLEERVGFTFDPDWWDELVLELTNAIPGLFLGAVLGGGAGIIGAAVGAIVGYVAMFVAAVGIVTAYEPTPPDQADCVKLSDTELRCLQPLKFPSDQLFGSLSLGSVQALCDGPLLMGHMASVLELDDVLISSVELNKFNWVYRDACGSPTVAVSTQIYLSAKGNVPLHLCAWSIPDGTDLQNQFLKQYISTSESTQSSGSVIEIDITLTQDQVTSQYSKAPYPLQLIIQTNGGSRLIVVAAIPSLTPEIQQSLELQLIAAKASCMKYADAFWSAGRRWDPRWEIDPGDAGGTTHLWQVAVQGLGASERLVLEDAHGNVLGLAISDSAGGARVDVLTEPAASTAAEIVVLRQSTASAQPFEADQVNGGARQRRARVVQTLFRRAASLQFTSRCTALLAGTLRGAPMLFCLTESGRHGLYDLTIPHIPILRRRVEIPGLRGIERWEDGFVVWGHSGIKRLDSDGRCLKPKPSSRQHQMHQPIAGLASRPGALYAIVDGRVHILDADLKEAGTLDNAHASMVSITRGNLVVHGAGGVFAYSLTDPLRPVRIEVYRARNSHVQPWLAGSSRTRRIVARMDGHGAVEIWTVGRSIERG